ncbi:MAG: glycosyltransferase, partial [Clostridia bacterium]|nr:glycosyltransferase [Clostridia bacterium]
MKKVLIAASVISFIEWFNRDNIAYLLDLGCEVHIACNTEYMEDTDALRTRQYLEELKQKGVILHHFAFARSPFRFSNIKAYKELKKLIKTERFCAVHCHTPTVSILTRLAAASSRKQGTKVVYTAHGYHFFKGAPLKNWIAFYPIERFCSRFTDVLITINEEDYKCAKRFCRNKKVRVEYVPGVGIDTAYFKGVELEEGEREYIRKRMREGLGV